MLGLRPRRAWRSLRDRFLLVATAQASFARAPLPAHTVGGQAVIEGVMMRSEDWWAIAVRRPEGTVHTESHPVASDRSRFPKVRFLRGVRALGQTLSIGMRAISISARESSGEEAEVRDQDIALAIGLAVLLVIGLFIVLPALVIRGGDEGGSLGLFVLDPGLIVHNLVEGGVRIGVLFAYIGAVSLLGDVRRVFAYHGAEHRVIAGFEDEAPRSVEGVRRYSTIHMRCGTNFLFLVMLLAAVVFSIVARSPWWWRIGSRIILLPVVAALSYEVLRFSARHRGNPLVRLLTWPGLALQRVTTRKPDDEQVEVALAALGELLDRYEEAPEGGTAPGDPDEPGPGPEGGGDGPAD